MSNISLARMERPIQAHPAAARPVLSATRLGKRFGGFQAVKDVDIHHGEVHALIGVECR